MVTTEDNVVTVKAVGFSQWIHSLGESASASVARGVNLVLGLGTSVLLARELGPEGRGELAVVLSLATVGVQLCNFGFAASLPYFIARTPAKAGALLRRGLRITSVLCVLWTIGLALYFVIAKPDWGIGFGWLLLILSTLLVPASVLFLLGQNANLGIGAISVFAWSDAVVKIFTLIAFVVTAATIGLSIFYVCTITICVLVVIGIVIMRRVKDQHVNSSPSALPRVTEQARYGIRSWIACLVAVLPARMLAIAMIDRGGAESAGHFAVSMSIIESVIAVISAFVMTRLVILTTTSDLRVQFRKEVLRSLLVVAIGSTVISACIYFLSGIIIEPLFGSKYQGSIEPLRYAVPSVICMSVGAVAQTAMAARGMPWRVIMAPIAAVISVQIALWNCESLTAIVAATLFTIQSATFAFTAVVTLWLYDRFTQNPTEASLPWPGFPLPPENSYGSRSRLGWIMRHLHPKMHVAEFGCGTGLMVTVPLRRSGVNITGWDIHEPSISFGRAWVQKFGEDSSYLKNQPIQSANLRSLDVVIASEVLEHLDNDTLRMCLKAIQERLVPGGLLLITVPNGFGWFEVDAWFYRSVIAPLNARLGVICFVHGVKQLLFGDQIVPPFPSTLADNISPHVQWFTAAAIRNTLEDNGFEVVSFEGSTLLSGPCADLVITGVKPLMWLNSTLGRCSGRFAAGFRLVTRVKI